MIPEFDKIYEIEYKWNDEWRKGWGRLNTIDHCCGYVNVITEDGGISNVPNDDDIKFIKLVNYETTNKD